MALKFDPGGTGLLERLDPSSVGAPYAGSLNLTQPLANRVYQRSSKTGGIFGRGTALVPLTIAPTQPVGVLEYRLRDASNPGNIISDWSACTAALGAGSQTVNVRVPAALVWFLVDLRANGDATSVVSTTSAIGVGRVIAAAGQSEAVRLWGRMDSQTATIASSGVTISPFGGCFATYTDSQRTVATAAWALPADGSNYDSTGAAELLRLQVRDAGVVCALIGFGYGGTQISTWLPGNANWTQLAANIAASGSGGFEQFCWFQGASDAAAGLSTVNYMTSLTTLFAAVASINTLANFDKITSEEQSVNSTSFGNFSQVLAIRLAHIQWCAANGATYVSQTDADLSSTNLEISMGGYVAVAHNWHRAMRPSLGLSNGSAGPTMGQPTISGSTITIPVTQAGGTNLVGVGAWWNRFIVYPTGTFANPLAITGGSLAANAITLTLSAAPSGSVDVYYDFIPSGQQNNSGLVIYDNNNNTLNGDGIFLNGVATGRLLMHNGAPLTIQVNTVLRTLALANTTTSAGTAFTSAINNATSGSTITATSSDGTTMSVSNSSPPVVSGIFANAGSPTLTLVETLAGATGSPKTTSGLAVTVGAAQTPAAATPITLSSPTYDTSTAKFGQALNGGTGTLPGSAVPPVSGAFTVEAWGKMPAGSRSAIQALFGAGSYAWIGLTTAGFVTGAAGTGANLSGSTNLADGAWHHYAFSVPTTGNALLFVDGIQVGSMAVSNLATPSAFGVRQFGSSGGNTTWAGEIDELAVFSGQRYTANFTPPTAPYTGNETNMVGVWHLDGNGTGVV